MRKQLLGFAIALAILIITVSAWVVWKSVAEKISLEAPTAGIAETITTTPTIIEDKNLAEAIAAGEDFSTAGESEKAAAAFAATASRYPTEIKPLILLAEVQINLGEFEKARANLKAAEQLDAVNPDIFILRGKILLKEEKFTEAEKEFGKAGEHGKFWQGVMAAFFDRRDEAKKLFAKTDDDRSFKFLKAFLEWENFPDSPKTHLDTLLTKSFIEIGEYELALTKIGPVLEDDADYRDAWLLTGYAQFAQKNFELAKQSWETAFALDSGKPETQYFLGLVNFKLDNLAEAEKFFLLARENRMSATDLGEKLAETYLQQGKYRAAADLLAEEIAKKRETSLNDFVKPISLYLDKLKDGRNAWNLANLAKQRFPEEAFAHNLAGWVSLSNGYLPEAREQLEKSIELNPQLPWP
ncbi:tetratricopeptide repeat protein, partial [Candidatus Gracilibacteria bacterium]|nr:tetratricopeptide repeat protein [Candidatus Gracilibacteria bacterium]